MDVKPQIVICSLALLAAFLTIERPAQAQSAAPVADEKTYRETQQLIDRTQARLDGINQANATRTLEIKELHNKVNEVIGMITKQKEDNVNLNSEVGVLNQLLTVERQTTAGLRRELDATRKSLNTTSSENQDLAKDLKSAQLTIRSQRRTLQSLERRVDALNRELGSLKSALANERAARLKAERSIPPAVPPIGVRPLQ